MLVVRDSLIVRAAVIGIGFFGGGSVDRLSAAFHKLPQWIHRNSWLMVGRCHISSSDNHN